MKKFPLIIVGPSGSGKTFLANYLIKNHPFKLVLSSMTRPKREGEVNLIDNEFLSLEEYEKVDKSGDFFMSVEFFGNKYGYRKSFVEKILQENKIPIAIVYAPVLKLFLKEYPESHVIFLYPKDEEFLIERMKRRGDNEEAIQKRLKSVKEEIAEFKKNKTIYSRSYEIKNDNDVYKIIEEIISLPSIKSIL